MVDFTYDMLLYAQKHILSKRELAVLKKTEREWEEFKVAMKREDYDKAEQTLQWFSRAHQGSFVEMARRLFDDIHAKADR